MTSENKNILLAEDNPGLARVLSFKFLSCGFEPITCADGHSAWCAFEQQEIAAVVTDHEMPGLSGLELIARVKQVRPDMPCFLVSGRKLELVRDRRVKELGIVDVFGKPFSPSSIVNSVADSLKIALVGPPIVLPIRFPATAGGSFIPGPSP
ncbi:response regulator [Roseiconus lacunae]|uniref:Response regulator n=1 Tax=Roseiconus lacunae TaxID=2605694 RepID=A0ABT7PJ05_9BACT|nr:response regulator [Roseiconus lacunae]MDM4016171.1 response regulator [Roseiconus lacunae]WRQ51495.1 response regulator [Stieleria sp. HD01]